MVSSISSTSSISQLFAKLDSKSQGYIEKSDLVSAFSQISTDSTEAEGVFAALDSDSDGKVTESEFSTTLSKLQEELDSQFDSMRLEGFSGAQGAGGMAGMPPPPPPENDSGFTKDELSSQLEEIGSTDSERASLISNIVANFEAADTDGDGKVSFAEAQTYDSESKSSATASDSSSTTASSSTANSDSALMMKIMQLMHAYGTTGQDDQNSSLSSLLSVSA
jgi:hypothetical protein